MLQRSPTYVVSLPAEDPVAELAAPACCRRWPPTRSMRWKNVLLMTLIYQLSRRRPELVKKLIRRGVQGQLPDGYDVDTHFRPRYNPWDQRLCVCPDGDLFKAIRERAARRSSPTRSRPSPRAASGSRAGEELEADLIVTATGLQLLALGGMQSSRRRRAGRPARPHDLQGNDAQRRPEPGHGDRLHQRLVDAQVRSDLRVRLPAAQPHGSRTRLRRVRGRAGRPLGHPSSRCSTSTPATSCARWPTSPPRAPSGRGGSTRTTRST